jgi:hypothetical protein
VRLVEGAFAMGILRVLHGIDVEALYPVHDFPRDEVEVTIEKPTYRGDGLEKMKPHLARASYRGVTVELSGGDELARVARAYVVVRATAVGLR